jgi:hypothetical protein
VLLIWQLIVYGALCLEENDETISSATRPDTYHRWTCGQFALCGPFQLRIIMVWGGWLGVRSEEPNGRKWSSIYTNTIRFEHVMSATRINKRKMKHSHHPTLYKNRGGSVIDIAFAPHHHHAQHSHIFTPLITQCLDAEKAER